MILLGTLHNEQYESITINCTGIFPCNQRKLSSQQAWAWAVGCFVQLWGCSLLLWSLIIPVSCLLRNSGPHRQHHVSACEPGFSLPTDPKAAKTWASCCTPQPWHYPAMMVSRQAGKVWEIKQLIWFNKDSNMITCWGGHIKQSLYVFKYQIDGSGVSNRASRAPQTHCSVDHMVGRSSRSSHNRPAISDWM